MKKSRIAKIAELELGSGQKVLANRKVMIYGLGSWGLGGNEDVPYPALWTPEDWELEETPPCAVVVGDDSDNEAIAPELPRVKAEDTCFVETESEFEEELRYWNERASLEEAWRKAEKNLLPQQDFLQECYKNWWDDQYYDRPKVEKLEIILRIYQATRGMSLLGEQAGMDLLEDEQDLISCTVRGRDFSGLDLSSNSLLRGIVFIDCNFTNCILAEEFSGENMFYRCDFTGAETLAAL